MRAVSISKRADFIRQPPNFPKQEINAQELRENYRYWRKDSNFYEDDDYSIDLS